MTNCKNCKMTDEYCASGDCPTSQSPRNHLATTSQAIDLTEQWRKGELPDGGYYINTDIGIIQSIATTTWNAQKMKIIKGYMPHGRISAVLAPVPSYDEWKNFVDANTSLFDVVKNVRER